MQGLTISIDCGGVRVSVDMVDDAGPEEIQGSLDLLLGVVRSARFRSLVLAVDVFSSGVTDPLPQLPDPSPVPPPGPSPDGSYLELVRLEVSEVAGKLWARGYPADGEYAKAGVWVPDALVSDVASRGGLRDFSGGVGKWALPRVPVRVRQTKRGKAAVDEVL